MKRAMGMLVALAFLGTFGMPMASLAGVAEPAPASKGFKDADKKGGMSKEASSSAKSYPDQVWSTDTAPPEPPKKVAAPSAKPYTGELWSTDTAPTPSGK
nr:hypothetical protein [Nitrospirota bacterium]